MLKYIIKRIGLSILILFGVSLILYILIRCMPVSFIEDKVAAITTTGAEASSELVENMKKVYGLEDDSFKGIVKGYFTWLGNAVKLDFGKSFTEQTEVTKVIKANMGVSFAVAFIATIFEFMIAIPLGVTASTHQYSIRDYVVTILVMIGISLPSFFLGKILQDVFAMKLEWFPSGGLFDTQNFSNFTFFEKILDYAKHLFIPVLTVVILSIGGRMRMTRTNMLEVLSSDYIRTARAKGLKEKKVIYKHAFRNTMIPLVTSLAGLLPSLFSGAIITEQIFNLPGIGNVAFRGMLKGDIPLIMGYNMFLALLSVIGVLLADLMYAWVDPRVKLK